MIAKNHKNINSRTSYLNKMRIDVWRTRENSAKKESLKIDSHNQKFINKFRTKFNLSEAKIGVAFKSVNDFYICYKNEIPLLSTQNLAKRFYEQSVIVVKKLIARNSKRIYQELKESKELVKLLSESTFRDLNKEEQNQMQEQMMDLLKSIPSLAIFMLPGLSLIHI